MIVQGNEHVWGNAIVFLPSCVLQKCKSSGTVATGIPKKASNSHRENLISDYGVIGNSFPGI